MLAETRPIAETGCFYRPFIRRNVRDQSGLQKGESEPQLRLTEESACE